MMKCFTWITAACLMLFASCMEDLDNTSAGVPQGEGVRIVLTAEGMNVIETRTATPDMEPADSRVEHVIVYAFNEEGTELLTRYQQDLEYPDNEIRMILPQDKGDIRLHAVCNYESLWNMPIETVNDLDGEIVRIDQPDGAFNGSMIMHGDTILKQTDLADKAKENRINVKRIAAKIDFKLTFEPEIQTDKFLLGDIRVYHIPNRSYLVERSHDSYAAGQDDSDAAYNANTETALDNYYMEGMLLQPEGDDAKGYTMQFYLFENRCGLEPDETYNRFTDKDMFQTLKGEVGEKRPLATYIEITGTYISDEGATTRSTSYTVYLGKNNYSDFNVTRNCHYDVSAAIRTCNDLDTRVQAMRLDSARITGSFDNPLDAHCNAVRCSGYTPNSSGWEIYVDEPDEHPWLEISFSSQYCPRIAGKSYDDDRMVAASRMEGSGQLTSYFYIHTDEYIPENPNANESLNNATDEKSWRTGYVILRDKANGTSDTIEVKQRPAQVVKMPIKNGYNEYFVEYELEQKNITWGFLKYGANPVMTGMINDRWDGLSNTRKLYQEAVKIDESNLDYKGEDAGIYWGAYNGYLTVEDGPYPHLTEMEKIIDRIPDDHMIKYVLGKNRDRNGNGYIDYDEIVWYVPALDELAELWRVLDEKHIAFQNSGDRFHSSTPYLAGYTNDVPGRAFYVKNNGETGFAMRDRQYNVICCRRKGAWTGNNDAALGGNVTTDNEWKEDGDILPKQ